MSVTRVTDNIYALRFIRLLTMDVRQTEAYKRGLIDRDGERTEKEIESARDKAAYTYFHRLVFNIRRLLNRVSFGQQRIASYVTALALIREETSMTNEELKDIVEDLGLSLSLLEDVEIELSKNLTVRAKNEFIINEDFEIETVDINDEIIIEEKIDHFEGEDIYRGLHPKTQKKVYLTARDVKPLDV